MPSHDPASSHPQGMVRVSVQLKQFLAVARVAFRVSIALAGINAVFCIFAALSSWAPRCAGYVRDEAHTPGNILALAFACAFIACMVGILAGGSEKFNSLFEDQNVLAFGFGAIRVTSAMLVFYSFVLMLLVMFAVALGLSVTQCQAMLADCLGWRPFI